MRAASVSSWMSLKVDEVGHLGLSGERSGVDEMLESHPAYLDVFLRFHHALLSGDGPLPEPIRHYIAMMAASRHQCSYLVEDQREYFLRCGGEQVWLEGLHFAPKRIQALHTTNKYLAHRPWLYDKSHVEYLLKSGWSLSELTHAICIMVHFHALCSLVHGTGMEAANGEPPVQQAEMIQGCTSGSPNSQELSEGGVEVLLDRMKNISRTFDEELPEEQKVQSFEFLKNQTAGISGPNLDIIDKKYLYRYAHLSPEPEYTYIDFGRGKGKEKNQFPILKSQDCSWEEHGFSLLSELYHEVGEILDDKFKTAYNLTYYTCGNKTHVDTYPFRRGVWNYLQCLYGIRHDYYDYRQVNKLLEANLKTFLKMVSCFPERLLPSEHSPPLMKGFLQSEKLHVVILVVEAKLQAELLYALRSIGRYLL
ncbi:UNVERIFIED_CONTAM: hypothetical protein RMT77_010420 [Armadillidium vulgare]